MSAKKECFSILFIENLVSITFLSLKLLFSGFDTIRFQIFFCFQKFARFSRFLVTLSHYWQFPYDIISVQNENQLNILKFLKIKIIVSTASTLLSSKNYLNFLIFVFNCHFYFVISVVRNFCIVIGFTDYYGRIDEPIFWYQKIDDFENNRFPKLKIKNFLTSLVCSFYFSFWYLFSLITGQVWHCGCQGKASKGIDFPKSISLKNASWPYWSRHRFFTKKS